MMTRGPVARICCAATLTSSRVVRRTSAARATMSLARVSAMVCETSSTGALWITMTSAWARMSRMTWAVLPHHHQAPMR